MRSTITLDDFSIKAKNEVDKILLINNYSRYVETTIELALKYIEDNKEVFTLLFGDIEDFKDNIYIRNINLCLDKLDGIVDRTKNIYLINKSQYNSTKAIVYNIISVMRKYRSSSDDELKIFIDYIINTNTRFKFMYIVDDLLYKNPRINSDIIKNIKKEFIIAFNEESDFGKQRLLTYISNLGYHRSDSAISIFNMVFEEELLKF